MFRNALLSLISIYQKYLQGLLLPCCRFYPSCSEYAKQAISKYGAAKGVTKASKRLIKCHPFSRKSGYDPLL